jgi:hypothetical protein
VGVTDDRASLFAFLRWSRDAGWRDSLYFLWYPVKTWRCRLFGHSWGADESDYEPNTGAKMQSWHNCQRRGCKGYQETWHYLGIEHRVYG